MTIQIAFADGLWRSDSEFSRMPTTLFFTRFKYYVHEQHSNDVILASFRVTKTVCNAFVIKKTQQCYFQYLHDLNELPYWVTCANSWQPSIYYTVGFLFKSLSNDIDDLTPRMYDGYKIIFIFGSNLCPRYIWYRSQIRGSFEWTYWMPWCLEFRCVSNWMLRNHIQNIVFITFLDDIISV
jgi:hypothetical protein